MIAAAKALDAVDAAINATFPRPGNWRWEANPVSRSVSLGTHRCEAMTFARWGMAGAQPLFMTRTDGLSILRDTADFLQPIPGRKHHKWAKRIEHPVAQTIELGVNLLGPLAAVARAAAEYMDAFAAFDQCRGHDSHASMRCKRDFLFAALDAFNAAAAAQGFGHQNPPHADGDAAGSLKGREPVDVAPSERVASAPAPSAEASNG